MFWRIRKAWRILWGRCPLCGEPLSSFWASHVFWNRIRFLEYCRTHKHYARWDGLEVLEFNNEDAEIELGKLGL